MEEWAIIPEFPNYRVSSNGQVLNITTDRLLERSQVQNGIVRVTLISDGKKYTRSVKVLVAEAFVPKPKSNRELHAEIGIRYDSYDGISTEFDTPIQLDGHELNLRADNLAWRTRSFAWQYKHQFYEVSDIHSLGPVQDVDSGEMYRDIYDAATANGLLFKDIWRCVHGAIDRIPPTNQRILLVRHINQMESQR